MKRLPEEPKALTGEEIRQQKFNQSFIARHLTKPTVELARILIELDPDPYDARDVDDFSTYYAKFAAALLEKGLTWPER